jgi:3-oxoacyl-[acyl-carrier protein] reductase
MADEIEASGGQAFPFLADMTDRVQVHRVVREVVDALGGIDVCVDIVGGAKWDKIEEVNDSDWSWVIDNNLSQVFYLLREVGQQMIRQGRGGSIVAIASVDGTTAAKYHAAYGAAKAGVISLAKTSAVELGLHGIRVNAVAPGAVGSGNEEQRDDAWGTDPVNPLAAPRAHDIGNAVLFLSSSLAARITGQTLMVDGGASVRDLWGMQEETIEQFRAMRY